MLSISVHLSVLSNIRAHQNELEPIFKASEQFLQDIKEARAQLVTLQRQRQETMWSIIRNPVCQTVLQ